MFLESYSSPFYAGLICLIKQISSYCNVLISKIKKKKLSYLNRAKIIFAGNPYFYQICQIGRQNNSPKKGTHWLGPGFKIGLNENLTNFREIQENIVLVMSTLIL